TRNIN
ncbi:hypothetical protein D046_3251B, partial [Vibrio parahaemolyticus V-223/04]